MATSDPYSEAMLAISQGRLNDAQALLTTLIRDQPRHAGAWLDLAMLYCASANADEAERLFQEIEQDFQPPPAIREVIARQRLAGCHGWQAKRDVTVRLSRGAESNANQGASNPIFSFGSGLSQVDLTLLPAYLPQADRYSNLYLEAAQELTSAGASAVVQLQSRHYDHLSDYNTTALFVGAEQPLRWGSWGFRNAASLGMMTLGRQLYLKQSQVQIEVLPPLNLPANWQASMAAGLKLFNYPALIGFNARWTEARAGLNYKSANLWLQSSLSVVQDTQSGQRPGGDRIGTLAALSARAVLQAPWSGEVGVQTQHWQGDRLYSPGLIDVRRVQNTQMLRLALSYQLPHDQTLVLEYKDVKNSESISIFGYRNQQLQLHWLWQPLRKT